TARKQNRTAPAPGFPRGPARNDPPGHPSASTSMWSVSFPAANTRYYVVGCLRVAPEVCHITQIVIWVTFLPVQCLTTCSFPSPGAAPTTNTTYRVVLCAI